MSTATSTPTSTAGVPPGTAIDVRLRERLRVIACCLALTCLATSTRPGNLLADTKIDMPLNPLGFLARALHLWDGEQFGQLQNQAVGYLFPMGPFYALADLAGLPAWITQRLWLAMLVCLAFLGTRRLAIRLRLGRPGGALVAGLVYALAPAGLASLGQISSDYLPFAMAPWILLPLVTAAHSRPARGGRGRLVVAAAARSGVAVACCGGINATATAAVLVVPFIYVLTRPRGTPRVRILACWSVAVAAATLWWLVPLSLTGTYGFSWLTYTEKASTTTGPTGLVNVFRGAERWVSYLIIDGQVWWPVGHALSLSAIPVLCTGVVAALGLAGLVRPRLPERTFLLLSLLAGIAIVCAGHISVLESPLAPSVRQLLDGPLAPLRNLHRFDAVVRLPLALGVAHLLPSMPRARARLRLRAVAFAALAGIGATALSSGLSGPGDFRDVPKYWRDAASWLNDRAGRQGVLAVPGAAFGDYVWGRPMDDVMQPLISARWGVRQLVPVGSPGYTRALDAVDQQVSAGRPSPGLAEFLSRMGIRYVLVRNDLRRESLRGAWPARLHQALDGSPGLRRAAWFGTPIGWPAVDDAVAALDQKYPPLEVYEVDPGPGVTALAGPRDPGGGPVSLADADEAIRLYGSPEAMLTMADNGLLKGRPVLLDDDAPGSRGTPVVSDSLRLVRRDFGELHQNSATLAPGERPRSADVTEPGWRRYATTAAFSGVRAVTASSSASDADAIPQLHDPGRLPYAAMDGDPWTYWEAGGWTGPVGQWLRVDFARPMSPHAMFATFVRNTGVMGPPPSRVAVETEAGSVVQPVRAGSSPQALRVPPGRTRWLRIRILGLAWRVPAPGLPRAGISELTVDGLHVGRHFQLPAVPRDSGPASFVMTRGPGAAPECMKGPDRWVCSPALRRGDEENGGFDRVFPAPAPAAGALSGLATLTDTALLQRFTGLGSSLRVTASSSRSADPAVLPRSAFDDDPATAWIPGENDIAPTLTLTWGDRTRRIDRLTVERPPGARGALRVRVRGRGGDTREGLVNSGGRLSFAPLNTDRLSLTFLASGLQTVQVTEVAIAGVRPFPRVAAVPIRLACGLGPGLEVNGVTVPTRVSGAMGDLLEGRPLRFQGCRDAEVAAGRNGLRPSPFGAYRIESAVIDTGRAPGRPHPGSVEIRRWSAGTRLLEVETGHRSFLVVDENFNRGWQATIGRDVLSPVRLDGWKQGWVLPAGAKGMVRLTYLPDRIHRVAVPAGLGVLALLSLLAFAGYRPGGPRPAPPPGRPRLRTARWAVPLSAAGLGFWLAGPAGLVVVCGAALIFAWSVARRQAGPVTRRSRLAGALASSWVIGGLMVAGTVSWALGAWLRAAGNPAAPTDLPGDVIPQLLGLVILGRLVTGLWHADRGDGPARRRDHLWRRPGERPDRARWPASRWTGRSRR